jgi:NADH dehydrogenase FAD-containing subunit
MATAKKVLILGGGFGGLTSASLIRKRISQEKCQITVIDKNQYFMMGLVNLWILSGSRRLEDSQVALNKLEDKGIKCLNDEIISIDTSDSSVTTRTNNDKLKYDYLIVALGAELAPERIIRCLFFAILSLFVLLCLLNEMVVFYLLSEHYSFYYCLISCFSYLYA